MKAFKHILALALLLMTAAVVTLVSANSGPALSLREYIMAPAAPPRKPKSRLTPNRPDA
jgi:hypothetical protein